MPLSKQSMKYYQRDRRARLKLEESVEVNPLVNPDRPTDPGEQVRALAAWSKETLRVPPGHPASGQALILPDFALAYLEDALKHPESLLCMARKNAKSAVCAVFALGFLVGPLRWEGWRGAVCSVSKEKANELRMQVEEIAQASGLEDLFFRRSPQPGRVESPTGALDILAADRTAGHASGFDVVIVDELGLFPERSRELMTGLRSSVSARAGRIMAISVQGDSELLQEILERKDHPGTAAHMYAGPVDCALDDREAWEAANPGLGTIKQVSYMEQEAARVAICPPDQPGFRAWDLNQRLRPDVQPILQVSQWLACETEELPPRKGPCFVGYDGGGSKSMTAAAAYWPDSGRLEGYGAWPAVPDFLDRGRADAVGMAYVNMEAEGELQVFGHGELTDVQAFLRWVVGSLAGERVQAIGSDRYKQAEAGQALTDADVTWPRVYRGTGAMKNADGSHDVRAFQAAALSGNLHVRKSTLWRMAVGKSMIRYDGAGNEALDKSSQKSRIDVLQAGVIACGLASIRNKKRTGFRYAVVR